RRVRTSAGGTSGFIGAVKNPGLEKSAVDTREGLPSQRAAAQRPTVISPEPETCLVTSPVTCAAWMSPEPETTASKLCATPPKSTSPDPEMRACLVVTAHYGARTF